MRESLENKSIRQKESKALSVLNSRGNRLTQAQIQAAGGVVKYVVTDKSQLASLDPQFNDIAFVSNAPGFAVYNGQVWVALAHYAVENIDTYNEIVLTGGCASLIVVDHKSDLPDDSDNGSLGYVTDTEAYYIKHDDDWIPITAVKVSSYTDLPTGEKAGSIYYVSEFNCFYIKRTDDWKSIGTIELDTEDDLGTLTGKTGDLVYTKDTDRYYIFKNLLWVPWDSDITVVDVFPEIPDTPSMVWHTGDNQLWASSTSSWVPLMKFTTLTGEVGT